VTPLYTIEKNVPVSSGPTTRWSKLAMDMTSGDSVLVKNTNEATGLITALKRLGKKTRRQLVTDRAVERNCKGELVRVFCISTK